MFLLPTFVFAQENILPWWQEQQQHIVETLQQAQQYYADGDKERAAKESQVAHFTYYRNSDLESAIRVNYDMRHAEGINRDFFELTKKLKAAGEQSEDIAARIAAINADIAEALPGLPLTPRLIRKQEAQAEKQEIQRINNKDYSNDIVALRSGLSQALEQYQASHPTEALQTIQEHFQRHWQDSSLSESLEDDFRASIEGRFDKLYKDIQQKADVTAVKQDIDFIQNKLLESATHKRAAKSQTGNYTIFISMAIFVIAFIFLSLVWRRKKK